MREDDLEELLRRWGRVYGERSPVGEWGEEVSQASAMAGGYGNSVLAAAMDYAPGRVERSVSVAFKRKVQAGERVWSRDPIACTESRHYSGALYFSGAEVGRVDPDVGRVERAAVDLYRIDTQRGLVLRAQYCTRGTQQEKTDWVNAEGRATALTLRTFRSELVAARAWMHGRLTVT